MVNDPDKVQRVPGRQLIFATAGHVDHGKTSLIKQLTGVQTDTLAEEQQRGLTINPGFAYYHGKDPDDEHSHITLGFVDVPGHADFIHNMLAGVGTVEQALLVVACDDGIMPQTREHVAILRLLGIRRITVALSKIDRCSTDRVQQVQQELESSLLSPFSDTAYFPVSSLSGEGIPALNDHLIAEGLRKPATDQPGYSQGTRFLIDRAFTVKGIGTVVTGALRAGRLTLEDRLTLTSNGDQVRVRGLRLDNKQLEFAHSGQRAAVNITANQEDIERGDWLAETENIAAVYRIDSLVELLDTSTELNPNTQYHLHLGASHHIVTIRRLNQEKDFYQIRCHEAMHAHHGDRFVIRDPAARDTIGGGQVLDIFVPRKGRTDDRRIQQLDSRSGSFETALPRLLSIAQEGVDLEQFKINYNLTAAAVQQLIDSAHSNAVKISGYKSNDFPWLLHEKFFAQHRDTIIQCIREYHQQNPHQQGISEANLSKQIKFPGSHMLLGGIVQQLVESGDLRRSGTLLHLPDHAASLSSEEKEFLEKIHPLLQKHGKLPPRTRELAEMTNIPLKPLERILKQCTQSGMLIRVAPNRHYLPETIAELAEFTEKLAASADPDTGFSVIQFRDASGIGRNLCIDILEYFDRVGFTRRDENTRFLRTAKENIFG